MKCQNLKTQEVVAVKVVKNRTAYFNQSMMEVSVLDLVCSGCTVQVGHLLTIIYSSTASLIRMTITIFFV